MNYTPELVTKFGRSYNKGDIIFCEYENGEELYFIIDGKVRISKITVDAEKIIAYLGSGEYFGEMAIFGNSERTATVTAEEETTLLVFNKSDFYKLIDSAPGIVIGLMKALSSRYISTEKQLSNLLIFDYEKRVFSYMYEKCLDVNQKSGQFKVELAEMEALLNISKEDIFQVLENYRRRGNFTIDGFHICINDTGWWIRQKNKDVK